MLDSPGVGLLPLADSLMAIKVRVSRETSCRNLMRPLILTRDLKECNTMF